MREGPDAPDPPGIRRRGPGDAWVQGSLSISGKADESCLFCVYESRLSHPLTKFFFRAASCVSLNANVARHAHVSLHNAGNHNVQSSSMEATRMMKFIYAESIAFQAFDC